MFEKHELRYFVAVWMWNKKGSVADVCLVLEKHLTIEVIQEIGDKMYASYAYSYGGTCRSSRHNINPYPDDTIDWWYWYAGYHK